MVGYKKGRERYQGTLLPLTPDDYIGEDHECRVIDAFVDKLDLAARGFTHTQPQEVGCPAYAPGDMLKLYLYGYLNKVRSSRRLERETQRNIEVMWLINSLTPDDKTICNFRTDNAKILKEVFRDFNKLCLSWGLFGRKTEAYDGSKVKANNSRKNCHTKKEATEKLAKLEKRITEYLNELEENDRAEAEDREPDREAATVLLKKLNGEKEKLEDILKQIEENDGAAVCTVDPEAELMKQGGGKGFAVCYNIQTAVDEKYKMVAEFDVTDHCNDMCELSGMVEKTREMLEVEAFNAVADKGFSNGKEINACENMGVTCFIPIPEPSHQPEDPAYHRDKFIYNEETNSYTCPEGHEMPQVRTRKDNGFLVYANRNACLNCPAKGKCTKSKTLREIERNPYQAQVERAAANAADNPDIYRRRQELSEHPFGVVKHVWGFDHYLCRGKEKVTGETALAFLAFNFRRALNILGVKEMVEKLA